MKVNESLTSINRDLVLFSKLGNLEVVKYLVEKGANPNLFLDQAIYDALCTAAANGHLNVAKYLVEHVNTVNGSYIYQAILYAAFNGQGAVVEYLELKLEERSKT